jgi:DNA-binding NarL/FixJ family response regulator
MRVLRDLRCKQGTAYCLLGLAGVAVLREEPVRAARLWGTAEALREAIGLPLSTFDRANYDYEGYQAAARSRLDDEAAWQEAWVEGRAMTFEEAIEYASATEEAPSSTAFALEQEVAGGSSSVTLTPREREIAQLIARGFTNRRIAEELHIAERTVTTHVRKILKKLGVSSRGQVAAQVAEQRLPHETD